MPYKPYIGSEVSFTKGVAEYLDFLGLLYTHVANEIKTDVKVDKKGNKFSPTGNKLKAMGKKAGVPDILIFEPKGKYVGFAIELKVGDEKPKAHQFEWLAGLQKRGWKILWSNSIDEVIYELTQYIQL